MEPVLNKKVVEYQVLEPTMAIVLYMNEYCKINYP